MGGDIKGKEAKKNADKKARFIAETKETTASESTSESENREDESAEIKAEDTPTDTHLVYV